MQKKLATLVKRLGYSMAALVILVAFFVCMGRLLTPFFNAHLPNFENWSTQLLKTPVKIEHVQIHWNWYEPEIAFNHVTILDATTRKPKFSVNQIRVNLQLFRSLLFWRAIPENILIDGTHLTLREPSPKQLSFDELSSLLVNDKPGDTKTSMKEIVGFIFSEPQLVLKNITISYFPFNGNEKKISIPELSLINGAFKHELRGNLTVIQQIPMLANFHLTWRGSVLDFPHISAKLYLSVQSLSLSEWINSLKWGGLQFNHAIGNAQIWLTFKQNQFQQIQSQFQLYDLKMESLKTQRSFFFPRLSGHIDWRQKGDKQVITGEDLLITFPDHLWPVTGFKLDFSTKETPIKIENAEITYLNLSDVKQILLDSGLLTPTLEKTLVTLNPLGELRNVSFTPASNWLDLSLSMEFNNLSINSWNSIPGIRHLTGFIRWKNNQGHLQVDSADTTVLFPRLFSEPLLVDELKGLFTWQKSANGTWFLNLLNSQIKNKDIELKGNLIMEIPEKESPLLNFSSTFKVNNVNHIVHYLPLAIFSKDLAKWLREAFLSGQLESGKALFQGRLSDFPFENHKGVFMVSGNLKEVSLNYAPHWPVIAHAMGKLIFSNNSMTTTIQSATILNNPLNGVEASIPAIASPHPQLNVKGLIKTSFPAGLDFIQESPLKKNLGKNLTELNLQGLMDMQLGLIIPLKNPETTEVRGNIAFTNASLALPLSGALLNQLKGSVQFTEKEIQGTHLQAQLFNQPITMDIKSQHELGKPSSVKVLMQGILTIPTLNNLLNLSLSPYAKGLTTFQAEITLPSEGIDNQDTQIVLKSNLKGMALNLPKPYGKTENDNRSIQINTIIKPTQLIQTKILYNDLIAALSLRKNKEDFELVNGIDLSAKQINFYGLFLENTKLQILINKMNWQVTINSDQVAGQLNITKNYSHISGKFQRLFIKEGPNDSAFINPKLLPALSISANDVTFGEKKLGNVSFETTPSLNGMQIKRLQINSSVANLQAEGVWELQDKKYHSFLEGQMVTNTLSQMLIQWGLNASSLIASNAKAQFQLNWPGAPYRPKVGGMSGFLSLYVGSGRVVHLSESTEAKMGLGRMLSIFSLQTIPRHLSLDFSDLFQNGYSFDSLKGSFKLQDGNAYTVDTRFTGPVASIDIAGRIGLQEQDYDLKLGVTTHVTGGLLTAAGVTAAVGMVNPIAGIATSVVGAVVSQASSNSNSKIKSFQYRITGPWSDPSWEQMSFGR